MIEIRLKQCCYQCNFCDVEVNKRELGFMFDNSKMTNCTVYCAHENVCKQYLESEDE